MKRFLIIALALIAVKAYAQNVRFQSRYSPNLTYKAINHIELKVTATFTGDQAFIDKLKSSGITQPMNLDAKIDINGSVVSNSLAKDSSFRVLIEYTVSKVLLFLNGKQTPQPPMFNIGNEKKLYGNINSQNHLIADSARDAKNDTSLAKIHHAIFNPALQYLNFPQRPIKIGDTVAQNMDLNIPTGDAESFISHIPFIYKLVRINNNNGFFDVSSMVNVKFSTSDFTLEVNGNGQGIMTYGITDKFPLSKEMKYDLKLKVTVGDAVANGTATMTTTYKASVN